MHYFLMWAVEVVSVLQDDVVGSEYRYDWMDQYWAANVLLATLTDGGTFHAQAQAFLKYWVCGTDEVSTHIIILAAHTIP